MGRKKIGRNEPCPCGSGFKYKHCCGGVSRIQNEEFHAIKSDEIPPEIQQAIAKHQRREAERIKRFGHVRPIITADHLDYKFVAVGNTLHYSKSWKTFHDFLGNYIAGVLGTDWGNAELKKPFVDRHPVIQWYHYLCDFQRRAIKEPGKVYSAIATGPVMAYTALAYDLYTLQHHALLQQKLVRRLKIKDQFQGARYEVYVAAAFVRAGFHVTLEDESDLENSHCEFVARHERTALKYAVEAKSRHRPGILGQPGDLQSLDKIETDVYRLLQKALLKKAEHDRVIFIDVNVPPQRGAVFETASFKTIADQIKRLEDSQSMEKPWPQAFVFFTNHPYHYVGGADPKPPSSIIFTAINMADFKQPDINIMEKYPAIDAVLNSVLNQTEIPHEF
jgi:hypothetical protein